MTTYKIGFPQIASYKIPVTYLLKNITNCEIIDIPNISNKTIELGNKNSPETLCTPFKYTLGTMLECIEMGANVLIQLGGGCRYGSYYALQKEIIKNLGYDVKVINLITAGHTNIREIYKSLKPYLNKNIFKVLYHTYITFKMVKYMDIIDDYIRKNIGFEVNKNSYINLRNKMLKDFSKTKNIKDLNKKYKYYKKTFKALPIKKDKDILRVGVIGELYTLMEPFANFNIEYELAKYNIEVTRYTNATYLLFKKHKFMKRKLKNNNDVKYQMGADASDNICHTRYFCENNYDGIIHIKSSFCTPEIAAMPVINKICKENDVPIMFLSYDAQTSETGIKTRIEAFVDMLEMRKNND